MALYHGGENDAEFVSSRSTPEDVEEVLMGYPNISQDSFTDLVAFKRICMARSRSLVEGTQTSQYLAFTGVSQGSLDEIDRVREERRGWLPRMRILYDGREEILIVKLMVGAAHECAAREFSSMFEEKLLLLGIRRLFGAMGSTRFGRPSGRSKEADVCYKPRSRDLTGDWPSFVIEVGVSESCAMLRADAAYWLTNSDGKTRIVILLSINQRERQILVERWEEVPRTRPSRSIANYSCRPRMMQSMILHANAQYDGPPLEIPAEKLFDDMPANIPRGQFLFTASDLNVFNETYWSLLR